MRYLCKIQSLSVSCTHLIKMRISRECVPVDLWSCLCWVWLECGVKWRTRTHLSVICGKSRQAVTSPWHNLFSLLVSNEKWVVNNSALATLQMHHLSWKFSTTKKILSGERWRNNYRICSTNGLHCKENTVCADKRSTFNNSWELISVVGKTPSEAFWLQ